MSSNITFNPSETNPTIVSGDSSAPAASNTSIQGSIDTQSIASANSVSLGISASYPNLVPPDNISIVMFYKLVGTATLQNQRAIREAFSKQIQIMNALYIFMNQLGLGVPGVTNALQSTYEKQKSLNNQAAGLISQSNQLTAQYNQQVDDINSAINVMNQAIQDHNSGQMSDSDFQQRVAIYNQFVAQKNQELQSLRADIASVNAQIENINTQIAQVNTELQQYGIQPAPSVGIPGTVPLLESANNQTITPFAKVVALNQLTLNPNLNPQGWYDTIQEILGPNLSRASEVFAFNSVWSRIINNSLEENFYFPAGVNIVLPSAYTTEAVTSNSTGRTATGQAFTDTAAISQLSELNKAAGYNLARTILKQYDINLSPEAFQDIQNLILGTLQFSALVGPASAVNIYADRLAQQKPDSKAFLSASAIGVADGVLNFVGRNMLLPAVTNLLTKQYGPSAEAAAPEINAVVNSSLLLSSASILSNALGLPGLTAQLMANVNGVDLNSLQEAAAPKTSALSSLGNPVSVTLARATLVTSLGAAQSAEGEKITTAIDNAIGKIGPYSTESTIRETLSNEFAIQGFSETNSLALANNYIALLKAENNPEIDTALLAGSFNNTAVMNGLSASLMGRGFTPAAAASISQTAASNAYTAPFDSVRGFRDNLIAGLTQQGIAPSLSATLASVGASIASNRTPSYSTNLNTEALTSSLKAQVNPEVASSIANQLSQNSYADEGLLRSDLHSQLVSAGLTDKNAFNLAQQAAVSNQGNSLRSPGLGQILSPNEIAQQIHRSLTDTLSESMTPSVALKVAQETTHTLLGNRTQQQSVDRSNPYSFTSLMEDQLDTLKGHGAAFAEAYENHHNRSRNLNAFLDAVQDPGQRFVITQIGAINEISHQRFNGSNVATEPTIGVQG